MSIPTASTVELLEDARELTRRAFVGGTLAEDPDGYQVPPTDPRACCFCAVGSLCHVAGAEDYHGLVGGDSRCGEAAARAMELLTVAARARGSESVADLADEGGVEVALALYDDALASARAEEASA